MKIRTRRIYAAAMIATCAVAAAMGVTFAAPAAHAAPGWGYCGESKFIKEIKLRDWPNDPQGHRRFQIVVYPKDSARDFALWALNPRDAVVDEWHAIQACVPGLYDSLADSIWQQLECHQDASWIPALHGYATGSTYDLESWRPPYPRSLANAVTEFASECLNLLGGPGEEGDATNAPYRPDLSTPPKPTTAPTPASDSTAPAKPATITVARGPAAPAGYRYAIAISGFGPNATVTITCHDSVDPGGFYTFSLRTDSDGNASTANQCYSGDHPEHWAKANGTESNHIIW